VGIPYVDPGAANAFTSGLGKGLAGADPKAEYTAYLAKLNSHGGIAGHQVKPIFHDIQPSDTASTYEGAACSTFTQDNHVQFVFDIGLSTNFLRCIFAGGVMGVINTGWAGLNTSDLAAMPGLLFPDAIALDRLSHVQADEFSRRHFFDSTAKVGILYFDESHYARAEQTLEAALKSHGVSVVDRVAIHYVASTGDVGQTATESQNAVLKFRSEGVTHVLFVETNAYVSGAFGIAADSQKYYPRYGYTSDEPLSNVASNVPATSLKGALFIGWTPGFDVVDSSAFSDEAKSCLRFMSASGNPTDTGNQKAEALTVCESVRYLKAALEASNGISRASLIQGAARLGAAYTPDATFAVEGKRADGVSRVRDGAFDTGCSCFRYTSAAHRV
jgi:hypothetical protein